MNPPIDPVGRGTTGRIGVQVPGHERGLGLVHDTRTYWFPPPRQDPTGEPSSGTAAFESPPRLPRVEVDVTPFLLHDPPQQRRQGRVLGLGQEQPVGSLRQHLVDRAPCHRHGDDLVTDERRGPERERTQRVTALRTPDLGDARRTRDHIVRGQHTAYGLAVPVLLGVPVRHERRDLGIAMGSRHEQVAEVAHGVRFDVVHVAQAAQRGRVERS